MGMAAGRLDRRIELLVHGISYDGHNQPIAAWSMLATVSASVRRATVRERLASGQVGAQATEIFEIRWSPDVAALNSKDRIG
ncbi:MAG: head-tail adaptor protein [Alphaproteobacteria bacterium]